MCDAEVLLQQLLAALMLEVSHYGKLWVMYQMTRCILFGYAASIPLNFA